MRSKDENRVRLLGKWLASKRDPKRGDPNAAGMTTRELAKAARVSQPWVTEVENGDRCPDVFDLFRVVEALRISPGELRAVMREILATKVAERPGRRPGPKGGGPSRRWQVKPPPSSTP